MSKLILAGVVVMALCVSPALAITVDANLTADWGVTADTDWVPDNGTGWVYGDDVVNSTNSGGEWYDIEALYINLNLDTNSIEWAMVTSYRGVEPTSGAALPPGVNNVEELRDGTVWDGTVLHTDVRPWYRHPVVALSFDNDYSGPGNESNEVWEYGIIMAPNQESQGIPDAGFTDTPELWAVSDWRGAHPNEFGPDLLGGEPGYNPVWSGPVDFDVADTANSQVATGSSAVGLGYGSESPQVGTTWSWAQNYIWEGTITVPTSVMDFETWSYVEFTYAIWCANNHTQGDRLGYGAPPGDDSPEASTWALLLCTVALGGYARRRRN